MSKFCLKDAAAKTAVNVPLLVKVWIVYEPEVVIVPPVEEVDTPVEPSVL